MFQVDHRTARIGQEILPFEVGYIPEYYQRKAEVQLLDTPARRNNSLIKIREKAKVDKYLSKLNFSNVDDEFLVQFLRMKKYDITKTISVIRKFFKLRESYPDLFTNFRFEVTVQTMRDRIIYPLPYRCHEGCTFIVAELDNWDPDVFPIEELRRTIALTLMQCLRDPMTQVNGFKAIIDVKSNPLKHLKMLTLRNMYLIHHGIQQCVPGRYKSVHIVNLSITFRTAWFLLKRFLSSKLKQRIHMHASVEELHDFFPKSILPVQYGGELENYDMTDWLRRAMTPEELERFGAGKAFQKENPEDSHKPS